MKVFNKTIPIFYFDAIWVSKNHKIVNFGQTGKVYIQNNVKFFLPDGSGDAMFCYNDDYLNVTAQSFGLDNDKYNAILRQQNGLLNEREINLHSAPQGCIVANRSVWRGFSKVLSEFIKKRILLK